MSFRAWIQTDDVVHQYSEGATREEAARKYQEEHDASATHFTTGTARKVTARDFAPDDDDIIEMMVLRASDLVGEAADSYLWKVPPEVRRALADRITAVIDAWSTEFGLQPTFWAIEDAEDLVLPLPASETP